MTNLGRIDAVIEVDRHIYVMEFKLGTVEEALRQIKGKRYFEKYLNSGKAVKLVGVSFDSEKRNLDSYKIETV